MWLTLIYMPIPEAPDSARSGGLSSRQSTTACAVRHLQQLSVSMRRAAPENLGTSHLHANGGDAIRGTCDEQSPAIAAGERIVGRATADGNLQDVVALRIEGQHAFAVADVD